MEKKERDKEIIRAIKAERTAAELKGKRLDTAMRNRLIKKALTKEFGYGNVRVRGDRGTAYGWVLIRIKAKKPHDGHDEERRCMCPSCRDAYSKIQKRIWEILRMTGLEEKLGTYYGDMGTTNKECIVEVELS